MATRTADDDVTEITALEATKVAGVQHPANRTPFILLKAKAAPPDGMKTCPTCKGDGKIRAGHVECPDCGGSGSVPADFAKGKAKTAPAASAGDDGAVTVVEPDDPDDDGDDDAGDGSDPDDDGSGTDDGAAAKSDSAEADQIEEQVTGTTARKAAYCGDPECSTCLKAEIVPLIVATAHASGVSKATLRAADRKKMPASQFAYVDPSGGKHLPIHDPAHVQAALGRFGAQDFTGAKDPEKAKQQAAAKIKTAADKLGVTVDDDTDVAQAAKGAVQDALHGTKAPELTGTDPTPGQSGLAGPATGALRDVSTGLLPGQAPTSSAGVIGRLKGGESAYTIPAEARAAQGGVSNVLAPNVQIADNHNVVKGVVKGVVIGSLLNAIESVDAQRNAAKAGVVEVPGPTPAQTTVPGNMPWETYDAATLDQVAAVLAACCNAVDAIATREQIEALSADPSDAQDAWDLGDASGALEYAMGVVARLAYHEGAAADTAASKSGELEKAYRRLRASDEKAVRAAHAALSTVLAQHDQAAKPTVADAGHDNNHSSEEERIQMELTKSEFVAGVQEILKAEREKDAERKQAKKDKAAKNANNNGDVTAQQLQDAVAGENDANDVESVGAPVQPKFVNKSEGEPDATADVMKALQDQLKAATDQIGQLGEQVQKIAKRPRSGGPVLDGQARGMFPAQEQRLAAGVEKRGDDSTTVIKSLEAQFEQTTDPIRKQDIGYQLTYARLHASHEQGRI